MNVNEIAAQLMPALESIVLEHIRRCGLNTGYYARTDSELREELAGALRDALDKGSEMNGLKSPVATRIPALAKARTCSCGRSARWIMDGAPACSRCVTAKEEQGLADGTLAVVPCSGGMLRKVEAVAGLDHPSPPTGRPEGAGTDSTA